MCATKALRIEKVIFMENCFFAHFVIDNTNNFIYLINVDKVRKEGMR